MPQAPNLDKMYVSKVLLPYLSSVYYALIDRGNKDYLSIERTKLYMGLPPLLAERIIR